MKRSKISVVYKCFLQSKYTFTNTFLENYNKISHLVTFNKIVDTKSRTYAKPIYLICKQLTVQNTHVYIFKTRISSFEYYQINSYVLLLLSELFFQNFQKLLMHACIIS